MQQKSPLQQCAGLRGAECSGRQLLFWFWRSIVKLTDIHQGLGKPVSHWLFSAKKKDKTDIESFCNDCQWVVGFQL